MTTRQAHEPGPQASGRSGRGGRDGYNPLSFDLVPAFLLVAVDLVVNVLVSWGWMVFAAYMGAGIALRLRIRAAN